MGRSILAEERLEAYIDTLIKQNKWFIGVVIGQQLANQKDFVVHLARTPDPVENEASEENGEEDRGDNTAMYKPSVERPATLEEVDEKWVLTHAKQVSRMLPGGLSVIGLFAVASSSALQNSQSKLKQLLSSIHRSLNKKLLPSSPDEITDRICLQIDMRTRKQTCFTFDVADNRSSFRPAEWKYQRGSAQWVRLESHMTVDIPIVSTDSSAKNLLKQIQTGMKDFCDSVKNSVMTLDGVQKEESQPVLGPNEKRAKEGKSKGSAPSDCVTQNVHIFLPFTTCGTNTNPISLTSEAAINIVGDTVVRAFVHSRSTVADAMQAVKLDIIRSLTARCELLCEEFDVTEEKEESEVYYTPVRIFCSLPNSPVDVCDYKFQDERQDEVLERIQELLDIQVDELSEVEKSSADDNTWCQQSTLSSISSTQSLVASPPENSNLKTYIGATAGVLVVFLASGLSYLFLGD